MASGSSAPANNSVSKGFDFAASDDILCSYEDYSNHASSNGTLHSDPAAASTSAKEFQKNRMTRSSMFTAPPYRLPEESSFNEDVMVTVDMTMKKYADNLMRFLEGISSRLSQLELYCYNLDKSIGEVQSHMIRDHGAADTKLNSLEKNLQEVHRSVQVLRDKQELAEAQKELAKIRLAQKESNSGNNSQQNEERNAQHISDTKMSGNSLEVNGLQLALALPHQVAPRPVEHHQLPPVPAPPPISSQAISQPQGYYLPPTQLSHGPYILPVPQFQTSQAQEHTRLQPQSVQPQLNLTPRVQATANYQQQQPPAVFPPYLLSQPNPTPDMPMSRPVASSPEGGIRYGYAGAGKPVQPETPVQHLKPTLRAPGEGYGLGTAHPSISQGNGYVIYDGEGARSHSTPHPHFPQGGYPPSSFTAQNPQPAPTPPSTTNAMARPPQLIRNHPYNELTEKFMHMGYRGDHVINVIQKLEETGQPVDFNTVLDRLNGHSSGAPYRGW
ncbi:PREDICTED: mediator of RNA polymerase II transcription subunit 15-like [Ipomoea nil]|uniref:mediator of RNA polymerase II transcription subunit 15-like n=1 Tax=Ipomoea nil TaxID=35883 RepID=UPI00090144E2|nr:PREDICTED: mediator of RNA polymerase II transcription subunit 15-like [Ipomoea nil]